MSIKKHIPGEVTTIYEVEGPKGPPCPCGKCAYFTPQTGRNGNFGACEAPRAKCLGFVVYRSVHKTDDVEFCQMFKGKS